jgi:hypothetical protein
VFADGDGFLQRHRAGFAIGVLHHGGLVVVAASVPEAVHQHQLGAG